MEEMNGWDPMSEDFHNSSINSYDTGPGANLPRNLQPALFKKGPENMYKIYVRGLTVAVTEQSLKNIFHKFGTIKDVIIDRKHHYWAIITFTSQEAAINAIQEMNDHPEYNFKVTYARDRVLVDDTTTNHRKPADELEGHSISVNSLMNSYRNPVSAANHVLDQGTKQNAAFHGFRSTATSVSYSFSQDQLPGNNVSQSITDDFSRRTSLSDNDSSKYAPAPVCRNPNCGKLTNDVCSECFVSFCDRKCSFEGYSFHRSSQCILVAKTVNSSEVSCLQNSRTSNGMLPRGGNELSCNSAFSKFNGKPNVVARNNDVSPSPRLQGFSAMKSDSVMAQAKMDGITDKAEAMQAFQSDASDYLKHSSSKNVTANSSSKSSIDNTYDSYPSEYGGSYGTAPHDENRTHLDANCSRENVNGYRHNDTYKREFQRLPRDNQDSAFDEKGYQRKEDGNSRKGGYSDTRGSVVHSNRDGRDENQKKNEGQRGISSSHRTRSDLEDRRLKDDFSDKRSKSDFNEKRVSHNQRNVGPVRDKTDIVPDSDDKISFSKQTKISHLSRNRSLSKKPGRSSNVNNEVKENLTSKLKNVGRNENQKVTFTPLYTEVRNGLQENVKALVYLNEVSVECQPDVCTVRLESERRALESLMADMQAEFSFPPLDLKIKQRCVVYDNDECYRGIITSEKPLKVRCVDRGYNSHEYAADQLRALPDKYCEAIPFSYRVRILDVDIAELQRLKSENAAFEIIPIEKENSVWNARFVKPSFDDKLERARQKRDASKSPCSDSTISQSTQSVGSLELSFNLNIGKSVHVLVTDIKDDKYFYISNSDMISNMVTLTNAESTKALPVLTDISTDKMCLAFFEGLWYRARIVSVDPLKIYFIDFGNIENADTSNLKCLPEDLMYIKPLAVLVRFAEGTVASNAIEANEMYTLVPIQMDVDNKAWIVKRDQAEIFKIKITHIINETEMYVCKEEDIPKVSQASEIPREPLKSELKVGLVCHSNYEGDWCRAQVVSISPLKVLYIDFGNVENASVPDLMEISQEWQQIPPMAFLIKLKEKPSIPLNVYEEITVFRKPNTELWEITKDFINFHTPESVKDVLVTTNEQQNEVLSSPPKRVRDVEEEVMPISFGTTVPLDEDCKVSSIGSPPKCSIPQEIEVTEDIAQSTPTQRPVGKHARFDEDEDEPFLTLNSPTLNFEYNLRRNETVTVTINGIIEPGVYGVMFPVKKKKLASLENELKQCAAKLPLLIDPQVGEVCAVVDGEEIWRCKILSVDPCLVQFLDVSFEEEVIHSIDQLRKLPKKLKALEPLVFKIALKDLTVDLDIGSDVTIKVIQKIEINFWLVEVCSSNRIKISEIDHNTSNQLVIKEEPDLVLQKNTVAEGPGLNYTSDKNDTKSSVFVEDSSSSVVENYASSASSDVTNEESQLQQEDRYTFTETSKVGIDIEVDPSETDSALEEEEGITTVEEHRSYADGWESCDSEVQSDIGEPSIQLSESTSILKKYKIDIPQMPLMDHTILDITENLKATFVPTVECNKMLFTGMFLRESAKNLFVNMCNKMANLKVDPTYKPTKGELVAVKPDDYDTWIRCIVIKEPTALIRFYSVLSIDFGRILQVEQITRVPREFRSIPRASVWCKIISDDLVENETLELYEKYLCHIKVLATHGTRSCIGLMCKFDESENSGRLHEVEFIEWKPTADHIGVQYYDLQSGDRVKITALSASNEVFIRPSDEDNDERRMEILDLTAKSARKACNLDREPRNGELVSVHHDNSYWRGEILNKVGDLYNICLIDLGRNITVPLAKIKILDDDLKLLVRTAVPVTLKDVRITEISEKENLIVQQDHEFQLIIEDDSTVTLKFLENVDYNLDTEKSAKFSSLNEYLNHLLTPIWLILLKENNEFEPRIVNYMDIKIEEWLPNSVMNLQVRALMGNNCSEGYAILTAYDNNGEVRQFNKKINLEGRLQEYCMYNNQPYVPKINQICIAKSSANIWERAVCLFNNLGSKIQLLFIDSGRIEWLWNTDIRHIEIEFVRYAMPVNFIKVLNPTNKDFSSLIDKEISCYIQKRTEEWEYEVEIEDLHLLLPETVHQTAIPETDIEF